MERTRGDKTLRRKSPRQPNPPANASFDPRELELSVRGLKKNGLEGRGCLTSWLGEPDSAPTQEGKERLLRSGQGSAQKNSAG